MQMKTKILMKIYSVLWIIETGQKPDEKMRLMKNLEIFASCLWIAERNPGSRPLTWKTRENPGSRPSTFDDCEFHLWFPEVFQNMKGFHQCSRTWRVFTNADTTVKKQWRSNIFSKNYIDKWMIYYPVEKKWGSMYFPINVSRTLLSKYFAKTFEISIMRPGSCKTKLLNY